MRLWAPMIVGLLVFAFSDYTPLRGVFLGPLVAGLAAGYATRAVLFTGART